MRALALIFLLLSALAAEPALADMPTVRLQKKPCSIREIIGTWHLKFVYEDPEGERKQAFKQHPHQYLFLSDKQTFARTAGSTFYAKPDDLQAALRKEVGKDVLQYVLSPQGVLYEYVNGKATEGMYCQMVLRNADRFARGDMVLSRSSSTQPPVRVVEIYGKPRFAGGIFAEDPSLLKRPAKPKKPKNKKPGKKPPKKKNVRK